MIGSTLAVRAVPTFRLGHGIPVDMLEAIERARRRFSAPDTFPADASESCDEDILQPRLVSICSILY